MHQSGLLNNWILENHLRKARFTWEHTSKYEQYELWSWKGYFATKPRLLHKQNLNKVHCTTKLCGPVCNEWQVTLPLPLPNVAHYKIGELFHQITLTLLAFRASHIWVVNFVPVQAIAVFLLARNFNDTFRDHLIFMGAKRE